MKRQTDGQMDGLSNNQMPPADLSGQGHKKTSNADTVNVGIFAGRKFRENVVKTFHVGVTFKILLIFP